MQVSRRFGGRIALVLAALLVLLLGACSSLPPGSDYPKSPSSALADPENTQLGRQFAAAAQGHAGESGFHIVPVGADGFLIRMQLINAAERSLDLQYFIFRGDETGRLLTSAVLRAADRGVRSRVLIDDGETITGDEQITALESHPSVEIRIFNPFRYRGHSELLRAGEFLLDSSRLDHRMHNKLLVVDNSIALIGGRNIGDEYFQIDPSAQFADDDLFSAGPVVRKLSATFDEFWNSALSIPAEALSGGKASAATLVAQRGGLKEQGRRLRADGVDYAKRVAAGEPLAGLLSGRIPLVWADVKVLADSPEKRKVDGGEEAGRLMRRAVVGAALAVKSELLMITPYLIPGREGMQVFDQLRSRDVRVRILTNSLESATVIAAQSGYMSCRIPLLERGVELYEIRSLLGNARGSGQTQEISRYGNYSLHAKLFVFDRRRLFIGSMNFDQRSLHLNTEIGLMIDSPELAGQVATRFEAMIQPANAYRLTFEPAAPGDSPQLVWHTREGPDSVDYTTEPARSDWQRIMVNLMSWVPMDGEL